MFQLTPLEKEEIINGSVLSGEHINKFHLILEAETNFHPQNVNLLGLHQFVQPHPIDEPLIQLLPDYPTQTIGDVGHWTTFYYDKNVIHKYESKNYSFISHYQKSFLDSLFPHCPKIVHHITQEQTNQTDCGPFAIAFATAIFHNIDPSNDRYDTTQLRPHLLKIYSRGKLITFPTINNPFNHTSSAHTSRANPYVKTKTSHICTPCGENSSDSDNLLSDFDFQDNSEDDQEYEEGQYSPMKTEEIFNDLEYNDLSDAAFSTESEEEGLPKTQTTEVDIQSIRSKNRLRVKRWREERTDEQKEETKRKDRERKKENEENPPKTPNHNMTLRGNKKNLDQIRENTRIRVKRFRNNLSQNHKDIYKEKNRSSKMNAPLKRKSNENYHAKNEKVFHLIFYSSSLYILSLSKFFHVISQMSKSSIEFNDKDRDENTPNRFSKMNAPLKRKSNENYHGKNEKVMPLISYSFSLHILFLITIFSCHITDIKTFNKIRRRGQR